MWGWRSVWWHEPVAHAWFGEQQVGGGGVVELLAEVGHIDPQVLGFFLVAWSPDLFEQEAVGAQPAGVGGQDLQESVLGAGEPHRLPVAGDQPRLPGDGPPPRP